MKPLAVTLALALLGGIACDKDPAVLPSASEAGATTRPATAIPSLDPVKLASGTATATAGAGAAVEASCSGETNAGDEGKAEGSECAAESGGCAQWDQAASEVARRPVPRDATWRTIAVDGMTCGGCERRIIANLGQMSGVLAVEADAELGQVRVAMAPGNDLHGKAVERISSLGYKVKSSAVP